MSFYLPQSRPRRIAQRPWQRAQRKDDSLTDFHDFKLNDAITRALDEEKYSTPTPIQAQTIPTVMSGRDVIGIAQTGTGKTAAFALPILHRLAANPRRARAQNLPRPGVEPDARTVRPDPRQLPRLRPASAAQIRAGDRRRLDGRAGPQPLATAWISSSPRPAGCSISSKATRFASAPSMFRAR